MNAPDITRALLLRADRAAPASKPAALKPTCHCAAYPFPHRASGGRCECNWWLRREWPGVGLQGRLSEPRVVLAQVCGCCGLPASTRAEDYGIGHTEAWGVSHVHRDVVEETTFCGAELVDNTAAAAEARRVAA